MWEYFGLFTYHSFLSCFPLGNIDKVQSNYVTFTLCDCQK